MNQQADSHDGHPECDFALKPGSHSIVWVQILAEKLAGRSCHIENPEYEPVFDDSQDRVGCRTVSDTDTFYIQSLAKFHQQVLHCPERAEIAAEKFAEQHHSGRQHYPHHNLQGTHAARQRAVYKIGSQCLETSHRAVCLRVSRFLARNNPSQEQYQSGQHTPLQEVFRPVLDDGRFFCHSLISFNCCFPFSLPDASPENCQGVRQELFFPVYRDEPAAFCKTGREFAYVVSADVFHHGIAVIVRYNTIPHKITHLHISGFE